MTSKIVDRHAPADRNAPSKKYQEFVSNHGPHFTDPVHLRAAIPQSGQLNTWLLDAIGAITQARDGNVRLRAFRGFALDYQLTNQLSTSVPGEQRNAPRWLADHGGANACIAINQLAQWNLNLASWYIDRVNEIHHQGCHPCIESMDTYTFISAGAGWTPFGIHNDYEPSFIYHLGPGPKTAWIWPSGEPSGAAISHSPALNGVSFALADNLSSANRYVLEPGDFLCIPAGLYHVFENTHPSAFLGITVFPHNPQRVAAAHLSSAVTDHQQCVCYGQSDTDAELHRFSATAQDHLSAYETFFARDLRRLASCGRTIAPHPAILSELPEPNPAQPFTARFNSVCQRADTTSLFAYGRATHTGLPNLDTDSLCTVLNTLDRTYAADIAADLGAPTDAVTELLIRLTRLGALTQ